MTDKQNVTNVITLQTMELGKTKKRLKMANKNPLPRCCFII